MIKRSKCFYLLTLFSVAVSIAIGSNRVLAREDTPRNVEVFLLKYPYPYHAAVTVASDTHRTSVETFEHVHTLINTRFRINRDSGAWQVLFEDPEIDKREDWRQGIDGFGLPIADSMWLYHPTIGVFRAFDNESGQPLPHTYNGKDFREIIDSWIRKGWVDTLHAGGSGRVATRRAMASGLRWLHEKPHRQLRVWTNHSFSDSPSSIEPDVRRGLEIVVKNIVKVPIAVLSIFGAEKLARKMAVNPYPRNFPLGQRLLCWVLGLLLVISVLWAVSCLFVRCLRKGRNIVFSTSVAFVVVLVLYFLPMRYGLGDNPSSPFYIADLTWKAGFRYYWLVAGVDEYRSHIEGRLALPEHLWGERRTFFHIVRMDDGSQRLVFPRSHKRAWGLSSLELLTTEALENLYNQTGTAILYTHWSNFPKQVFTAKGLEGLNQLRRFYEAGRIWVAPTSHILHFHFIRTFLEYTTRRDNGKLIIEIERVNDPVSGPFIPTLKDLRGISFECETDGLVEIRLAGKTLSGSAYEALENDERVIVRFPTSLSPA